MDNTLAIATAASRAGITPDSLRRALRKAGHIISYAPDGVQVIDLVEFEEFLANRHDSVRPGRPAKFIWGIQCDPPDILRAIVTGGVNKFGPAVWRWVELDEAIWEHKPLPPLAFAVAAAPPPSWRKLGEPIETWRPDMVTLHKVDLGEDVYYVGYCEHGPYWSSKLNVEKAEAAREELSSIVDEWWRVADAEEGSDQIAPDGKSAHLGRINTAGQRAYGEYIELAGNHTGTKLSKKVPETFKWQPQDQK